MYTVKKSIVAVFILFLLSGCSAAISGYKHAKFHNQISFMEANYPVDGFEFQTPNYLTEDGRIAYLNQLQSSYRNDVKQINLPNGDYLPFYQAKLEVMDKYGVLFDRSMQQGICEGEIDGYCVESLKSIQMQNEQLKNTLLLSIKRKESEKRFAEEEQARKVSNKAKLGDLADTKLTVKKETFKNDTIYFESNHYKHESVGFTYSLEVNLTDNFAAARAARITERFYFFADELKSYDSVKGVLINDKGESLTLSTTKVSKSDRNGWIHYGYYIDHKQNPISTHIKKSSKLYFQLINADNNKPIVSLAFKFDDDGYRNQLANARSFKVGDKSWKAAAKQKFNVNVEDTMCVSNVPYAARDGELKKGKYYHLKDCGSVKMIQAMPNEALFLDVTERNAVPILVKKKNMIMGQRFENAGSVYKYVGPSYYQAVTGASKQTLVFSPIN